jgi:diguanylate cyclase (GGDEF)-like protein
VALQTGREGKHKDLLEVNGIHDAITGLYSVKFFMQRMQEEVSRARRYSTPLSLMLVGLSDPGQTQVKENVLRRAGVLLRDKTRQSDILGRIDEQTLAILLPNTDTQGAGNLAGRIRLAIEAGDGALLSTRVGIDILKTGDDSGVEMERRARIALKKAWEPGQVHILSYHAGFESKPG